MEFPITHVHIKSVEPHKSAEWWQKHFGARVVEEVTALPGTRTIRMAVGGNCRLFISTQPEGQKLPPSSPTPHLGLEHFGFDVPDLAKELARLDKEGVKIVRPLTVIPGGMKIAFVQAPDDVQVELVEAR